MPKYVKSEFLLPLLREFPIPAMTRENALRLARRNKFVKPRRFLSRQSEPYWESSQIVAWARQNFAPQFADEVSRLESALKRASYTSNAMVKTSRGSRA